MSEYSKKRCNYVNSWPNSQPFPVEVQFQNQCNDFLLRFGKQPFNLMKLWDITDDKSSRLVSHLIDSLDMMPLHPNWAFTFLFTGLDSYSQTSSVPNITDDLKKLANDLSLLCTGNPDLLSLMQSIFSVIPPNTCLYLYSRMHEDPTKHKTIHRITKEIGGNPDNPERYAVVDGIFSKYGYDKNNYAGSIRKAGMLYRKVFQNDQIVLGTQTIQISIKTKLHLLIGGILYTLRNDSAHGASMATTKSSMTTIERYGSNYYCFLAVYTIVSIILIRDSSLDQPNKDLKYKELRTVTEENVEDFKRLFGSRIK